MIRDDYKGMIRKVTRYSARGMIAGKGVFTFPCERAARGAIFGKLFIEKILPLNSLLTVFKFTSCQSDLCPQFLLKMFI